MHRFINLLSHFVNIFLIIGMIIKTIIKIECCECILLRRNLINFTSVTSIHNLINFAPYELLNACQQFHFRVEVLILET